MSEQIDSAEVTTGMDRRSVLKKAALVGAVAWTAPVIISNTVFAAAVCTPKCAHNDVVLTAVAKDACSAPVIEVPAGNKILLFSINLPVGATCPCSTTAPLVVLGPVPTQWDKHGPNSDGCPRYKVQFATGVNTPSQGSNTFALYKNGALGSGVYVPNGTLCVAVKCLDRDLTPVYRVCTFSVCFKYSPAQEICDTNYVVEVRQGSVTCYTGCSPCA